MALFTVQGIRQISAAPIPTSWNPSDASTSLNITNLNLTFTSNGATSPAGSVRSLNTAKSSQKVYFENHVDTQNFRPEIGFANSTFSLSSGQIGLGADSWGVREDGSCWFNTNGGTACLGSSYTTGDTVDIAMDIGNLLFWARKNGGGWNPGVGGSPDPGSGVGGISITVNSGPYYACGFAYNSGDGMTSTFASVSWARVAPSGFTQISN